MGYIAMGRAKAVVVACPTAPLTRQWARAAHGLGLDLAPDLDTRFTVTRRMTRAEDLS